MLRRAWRHMEATWWHSRRCEVGGAPLCSTHLAAAADSSLRSSTQPHRALMAPAPSRNRPTVAWGRRGEAVAPGGAAASSKWSQLAVAVAMAQAWPWNAEVEDETRRRSLTIHVALICFKCFRWFIRMLFYVDVAKVDLDILSKYCIFNERFEFSMQHETDVAADFFLIINGWLTIFFNIF